jgi:hypothetical protein
VADVSITWSRALFFGKLLGICAVAADGATLEPGMAVAGVPAEKYGLGALVVSQHPSEVDETILSQCGTFVALRLTNANDQARIRSAVPDELPGFTTLLPILRTGEAVIVGEATQIPSRVRIQLVEPRPASRDSEVGRLWVKEREENTDYAAAVTAWRRQQ